MENYLTISSPSLDEFTEKKSRFIGTLVPCRSHDAAMEILDKVRKENFNARHNVWAYILKDGTMRYSDDGEPQGTGGQPILEVLKKSGLKDVICIVTRYFGGILLGAGGLTRAYARGASLAVKSAKIVEVSHVVKFSIEIGYNQYSTAERILKEQYTLIENTGFTDRVSILCVIRSEDFSNLEKTLTDTFSATISPVVISEGFMNMPPKMSE